MNPYESTAQTEPIATLYPQASIGPWLMLCMMAAITVFADILYVVFPIAYWFVTIARETGFSSSEVIGWPYLIGAFIIFAMHLVVLYGCIAALCRKQNGVTRFTAMLSLVPVLTPLYILGIPFAIWAIVGNKRALRPDG